MAPNLGVPSEIKCNRCAKVKPSMAFSKKRQAALVHYMRNTFAFDPKKQAFVACAACTGGQVTELECSSCDKWKGLDAFPKTARRNPDKAECWRCSEDRAKYEPGAESDEDSSSSSGGGSDDDSNDGSEGYSFSMPRTSTLASDFGGLSIGGAASTYASRSTAASASEGGVQLGSAANSSSWAVPSVKSFSAATSITSGRDSASTATNGSVSCARSGNASPIPGFDPNEYGNLTRRPAIQVKTDRNSTATNSRGWTKIRAVPRQNVFTKAEEERQKEAADMNTDDKEWCVDDSDSD